MDMKLDLKSGIFKYLKQESQVINVIEFLAKAKK